MSSEKKSAATADTKQATATAVGETDGICEPDGGFIELNETTADTIGEIDGVRKPDSVKVLTIRSPEATAKLRQYNDELRSRLRQKRVLDLKAADIPNTTASEKRGRGRPRSVNRYENLREQLEERVKNEEDPKRYCMYQADLDAYTKAVAGNKRPERGLGNRLRKEFGNLWIDHEPILFTEIDIPLKLGTQIALVIKEAIDAVDDYHKRSPSIAVLIDELQQVGLRLEARDICDVYVEPADRLTPELKTKLLEHKPEIQAYLSSLLAVIGKVFSMLDSVDGKHITHPRLKDRMNKTRRGCRVRRSCDPEQDCRCCIEQKLNTTSGGATDTVADLLNVDPSNLRKFLRKNLLG